MCLHSMNLLCNVRCYVVEEGQWEGGEFFDYDVLYFTQILKEREKSSLSSYTTCNVTLNILLAICLREIHWMISSSCSCLV